ncbi:MAG: fumarylacetoacetate hydrolase family protein [Chloroflexota bacterium]
MDPQTTRALAQRLFDAAREQRTVPMLTVEHPELTEDDAYAVQADLVALHEAAGARRTGWKLGLTSRAKQREMGIDQPIVGVLLSSLVHDPATPLDLAELSQPRAEPEIAFVLARDLAGADVTEADVLDATAGVAAAIEVLDSRYDHYKFTLPDVVADQTSAGRYLLGPEVPASGMDLRLVGCLISRNGELAGTAAGAAVMGSPAGAVAWLVRWLAARGAGLRGGDVVLSGGLTAVVPLAPGDTVTAEIDRLGSVTLTCR